MGIDMIFRQGRDSVPTEKLIRRSSLVTVICDVILIIALVICLLVYTQRNNVNTYNQNVENVTSIAKAEAELLQAALDNTGREVMSAYRYCQGRTVEEILDYLSTISNEDDEYQLLMRDEKTSTQLYHRYTGYSTRKADGEYMTLEYENTALPSSLYSFAYRGVGELSFSQSFTNKTDGLRYYAVFCGISALEDGSRQRYYLIKPQKESKVLDQLKLYTQYSDIGLAVCYADGKYLACDDDFRADNFYEYLYKYNDLSLDQKDAVRASVQNDEDGAGVLTYKDYKGRDCMFAYATGSQAEKLNVIVAVPQAEFTEGKLLSFFPLIIIIFLVVLLAFNVWRLLVIVNALRLSVNRERVANTSKSSFLSRMSHEIRTPLNAVIGYNAIAKTAISEVEDGQQDSFRMKVTDCLDKSEIASKHLLSIINDVLDMSAIESGKIKVDSERFDFKSLIASLTSVFYSQARAKGVEFEVLFDTLTEEYVTGDQVRTNQILTNLLSNAVKFTPEGGRVMLRICQSSEGSSSKIHFRVSDTGIGMTQEYLEHIWTPFEQEDSSISRRFGGTGLGLSITKNLVDLMGGSISVSSRQGEGTVFDLDMIFERTEQPHIDESYDFTGIKALVADDDASNCDYIRRMFVGFGIGCVSVRSGSDAISAFSAAIQQGEPFTLCLIDLRMTNMDGLETIQRMKDIPGGQTARFALAAYDYSEVADAAARLGVDRVVSKPIFQSTLFDLLVNQSGLSGRKSRARSRDVDFDGARVLLVEDNNMNMEIAKSILRSAGLAVDCAWNGREAVDMFQSSPPGYYSALLMDVHMPVMDGHEATRCIRSGAHPDGNSVPIIAMTADAFAENVAEAHASGMNDHIAKPIDIATLFATLKKYING